MPLHQHQSLTEPKIKVRKYFKIKPLYTKIDTQVKKFKTLFPIQLPENNSRKLK